MTPAEEEIAFHYHLGKALSAWANVENTLRSILCACFDKGENNIAWNSLSVGFFSIDGFKAKMDFVEGAVLRRFPEHENKWLPLAERTRQQSAMRNKLAHRSVKEFSESPAGRRFVLIPWKFPKPKRATKKPVPPPGSLGLLDIVKAQQEFIAVSITLYNFCCLLQGDTKTFPASSERPDKPPSIPSLKAQILATLSRQPQPSGKKS